MELAQIWRYPVKSMQGEQLDAVALTDKGLPGDRAWATRSEELGGIRGARKIGDLMKLAAVSGVHGVPWIALPDGSSFPADDPHASERISEAVQHQVTLWPLQPATDVDHYRRGPNGPDVAREFAEMFDVETGEPYPNFSKFPEVLFEFESPPGTYFDAYPLLVLTTSSLASLQAAAPDVQIDVRRFRPNLVIDTPILDGYPELEWEGRRLQVGSAVLRLTIECPRCVMTTRGFADLPADRRVMRALVANTHRCFGVYAEVERPGEIALGDPVGLLS